MDRFSIALRAGGVIVGTLLAIAVTACGSGSSDFVADPQAAALDQLRSDSLEEIEFSFDDGIPTFLAMKIAIPAGLEDDDVVQALSFFEAYKDFFGFDDPSSEFFLDSFSYPDGEDEQHLFFEQRHNGVPVYAGTLAIHMAGGYYTMMNGRYLSEFPALAEATVTAEQATAAAVAASSCAAAEATGEPLVMYFDKSLLDPAATRDTHLAWRVGIHGSCSAEAAATQVFVDAHSAEILFRLNEAPEEKDFEISTGNNESSGTCWWGTTDNDLWFTENDSSGYPGVDQDLHWDGAKALEYTHTVYDYFHTAFKRHGWDGADMKTDILVHVDLGANTKARFVSFCNQIEIADGWALEDILAHEWTHAIDNFSRELEMINESGAMEESFCNFFAVMADGEDYTVGEDDPLGRPSRHFDDPTIDGDPDHYDDLCTEGHDTCGWEADDEGVHTNQGIPNKAAWLLLEGGTHHQIPITWVDRGKLQILYYDVLINRVHSNANFVDVRNIFAGTAQEWANASNKYGFTKGDVCQIKNAWAAVGVVWNGSDVDCDGTPDYKDYDMDNDGTWNMYDNCPYNSNPGQADTDMDGYGDACDEDIDGDTKQNKEDNCVYAANKDQADSDHNGVGDACQHSDKDGLLDIDDNCPTLDNWDQTDGDGDGVGDVCDDDDDNDGVKDDADNCPFVDNEDQKDSDHESSHPDNPEPDGVGDACDNCDDDYNPDQKDCNKNGKGQVCDPTEINVIGNCGKLDMDLETPAQGFVKPGDLVSLGACGECGSWLKPGSRLSITLEQPAAGAGGSGRGVQIVDDRGHVVKRGTTDLQQTISFAPRASFHYRTPGSQEPAFQKTTYFLQFVPLDAADENVDVDVDVDVDKDLVE